MVETENLIATKKESKNEEPSRHQFKTWYEYFFSVNNLCIGLTNFIIFPAKVHEYRGGAFLIAYFCMLIVIGYPALYLESIIGQYHRSSLMLFMRRCAPILQGFGWMSLVSAILILFPYQIPWSTCDNRWNTKDCYQFFDEKCPDLRSGHIVFKGVCVNETDLPTEGIQSAEEQYLHSVVHKSVKSHMSFSNFDSGMACSIFIIWLSIAFIQLRAGNKTTPLIYVASLAVLLDTILSLIIAGTLFSILGHISHSIGRDSVYDLTVLPPSISFDYEEGNSNVHFRTYSHSFHMACSSPTSCP
ncbi:hypothetical protein L5515_011487 [Caenorhabditis briggsae]|uniref:Uncharacterized protein n=1 Tax=Caenorhabditis briggsae TaxID=6238 RepID=A0AAE9EV50_CAEBR|nr:hypothetical protein L5515_011487 [Caenorhabditis briggsae]